VVEQRRGRTRRNYLIALAIFVVGSLVAALLAYRFISGLLDLTDSLTYAVVPGTTDIELSEPGRYTIFYEHRSVVDGRVFDTPETLPGLEIRLVSKETGVPVTLMAPGSDASYSIRGRSGRSVLSFRIDTPGTYTLTGEYAPGTQGPDAVVAVGKGFGRSLALGIGGAIASGGLFCLTTVAAIVIAAVTYVRSRRARQEPVAPAAS
jgi:hypothetical protein